MSTFNDTLGSMYATLSPEGSFGSPELMNSIVSTKFMRSNYYEKQISLHLRVGDDLEKVASSTAEILKNNTASYWSPLRRMFHVYSPPLSYYNAVAKRLKQDGENEVVIVASCEKL